MILQELLGKGEFNRRYRKGAYKKDARARLISHARSLRSRSASPEVTRARAETKARLAKIRSSRRLQASSPSGKRVRPMSNVSYEKRRRQLMDRMAKTGFRSSEHTKPVEPKRQTSLMGKETFHKALDTGKIKHSQRTYDISRAIKMRRDAKRGKPGAAAGYDMYRKNLQKQRDARLGRTSARTTTADATRSRLRAKHAARRAHIDRHQSPLRAAARANRADRINNPKVHMATRAGLLYALHRMNRRG